MKKISFTPKHQPEDPIQVLKKLGSICYKNLYHELGQEPEVEAGSPSTKKNEVSAKRGYIRLMTFGVLSLSNSLQGVYNNYIERDIRELLDYLEAQENPSINENLTPQITEIAAMVFGKVQNIYSKLTPGREIDPNELTGAREVAIDTQEKEITNRVSDLLICEKQDLERHGVTLEYDIPETIYQLSDETLKVIENALQNLINNAFDAIIANENPNEKKIIVKIQTTPSGEILITVSDTGIGMPDAIKEKIFEDFFTTKVRKSESPIRGGQGKGLSNLYQEIMGAKGKIDISSTPQKGSIFQIQLPLAA